MGQAGVHKIGMGVLLGLEEWRTDVTMMALHLRYLRKHYWRTRYSVNFPRLRPAAGGFQPNTVVSDRQLAQLTFAFRIFDHDVDISYSTRERPEFRSNMLTLGATSLSAGSKTDPGGYRTYPQSLEQFAVSDERSPREVYGHGIGATLRYNQVGIMLAWLDIAVVHRFEHFLVTVDYHLWRSAALNAVACDDTDQAVVGIGVDKALDIHHLSQRGVPQCPIY